MCFWKALSASGSVEKGWLEGPHGAPQAVRCATSDAGAGLPDDPISRPYASPSFGRSSSTARRTRGSTAFDAIASQPRASSR